MVKDAPARILGFFQHPVMMQVGVCSYSIYLWQQPFAKLDVGMARHLILLVPVAGAALASDYLVERPARDWLNLHFGRRRETETETAGA